jgi:hypothetical protein
MLKKMFKNEIVSLLRLMKTCLPDKQQPLPSAVAGALTGHFFYFNEII